MRPSLPDALRILHVVAAAALGLFVYMPWADDSSIIWITRVVVFPALLLTGAALWIGRVQAKGRAETRRSMPESPGSTSD